MFDILYILSIMSYCVKQAEKTQNLSKIGGFHFFFSRPQAGLTNQDHVRHYDTLAQHQLNIVDSEHDCLGGHG